MYVRTLIASSLLALGAAPVAAAEFCVGDFGGLVAALAAAQGNNEDDLIRLVKGNYAMTAAVEFNGDRGHGLEILGGYTAGCGSRTRDASLTVIDGGAVEGRRFRFHDTSYLTIESLHFKNLRGPVSSAPFRTPAIHIGDTPESNNPLTFPIVLQSTPNTNLRFIGNRVSGTIASNMLFVEQEGSLRIATNVFENNTADIFGRAQVFVHSRSSTVCVFTIVPPTCIEDVPTDGDGDIAVIGNTFVGSSAGVAGTSVTANIPIDFSNNIVAANSINTSSFDAQVSARNNLIDNGTLVSVDNGGSIVTQIGTLFGSANLDASRRPQPPSVAIDAAHANPSGGIGTYDASGAPRTIGVRADRGALESSFNAASTTIIVTNTNDSGPGSLRDAITNANADADLDTIEFDLAGACPSLITLTSALPNIVQPLVIDGYSQTGAFENTSSTAFNATLCVRVRGPGTPATAAYGLHVPDPSAATLTVRGLVLENFATAAVLLEGGSDHRLGGNQFGAQLQNGAVALPSPRCIRTAGSAADVVIGGAALADRNVVADCVTAGLILAGSGGHRVENNLIGIARNGANARGNGFGIQVISDDNRIEDNRIGGNDNDGILIFGGGVGGNVIRDNQIGISIDRLLPDLGNGGFGIRVDTGASGNSIGATVAAGGASNSIGYNDLGGIRIAPNAGVANTVRGNWTYNNDGLELELGALGITANDPNDGDAGGNGTQNYALLSLATKETGGAGLRVEGSLDAPAGLYRADVYRAYACNPGGDVENAVFLDSDFFIKSAAGAEAMVAQFDTAPAGNTGMVVVTISDSAGSTSEFSNCVSFAPDALFANSFD
jgi:hypothetical protein